MTSAVSELLSKLIDPAVAPETISPALYTAAAAQFMDGAATQAQMAGVLTALRVRGENVEALTAFAQAMRGRVTALPISVADAATGPLLDTCGTGGDHSGTFNISTAAAIVAAAAGVRVAKHGNRSFTSQCGSADVLEALGVRIAPPSDGIDGSDSPERIAADALCAAGICFLFAQSFHPAMRHVGPVRRELGFRTIFNLLGPLSNPAGATHQLIGVFSREYTAPVAEVLRRLGSVRAMVVHGADGLDEITTTGSTFIAELRDGEVREYEFHPREAGIAVAAREDLRGDDAARNAEIISSVLSGHFSPAADIVVINAAAALYVAEAAESIAAGVQIARETIASGAAMRKLEKLREVTNSGAPR